LNFEDGVTRFVECGQNEVLVDAAYRARVNLPMDCRDGVCGTCKCKVEAGTFELGDYIEDALSDEERDQGYALTCQMRPKSDCILSVPATSAMCKSGPAEFGARIEDVRKLSESTIGFSVTFDDPEALNFLPGQYVQVSVPDTGASRAYSFSSMLSDGRVEFLVRNIPGGLMSGYLAERAKPGDRLTIKGPSGAFYLRELSRPALFLAGGTGLAPFLAMLAHVAESDKTVPPIRLIYGVTRDADRVELEKLEAFARLIPGFSFDVCVSDPATSASLKGFVTDHFDAEDLRGGDCDVYLCGPPPMVEAVRRHFDAIGTRPAVFHYEKFNPAEMVQ
jgi:benzoate/toluate 1,2-dioxygenase reductase subunit